MAIDLRSDTVTRPTPNMLKAMFEAKVGDDVFGEDPTVTQLETEVAALLGKEAALFVPSGTMANQLALHLHTRPGDSVLAEAESHIAFFEAGAAGALSGVQFDFVPRAERLSDKAIAAHVRPDTMHHATTALLVIENTHTFGGGRVLTAAEVGRIARTAKSHRLAVHCDGARIWNAAAALGVSEASLVEGCDTVMVCFSKGLGAPVGSALVGPKAIMARARKLRKRWGGAMRQSGYLAAAALYALHHHRSRLVDDHRHAAILTKSLRALGHVEVEVPELSTNMVFFRPTKTSQDDAVRVLAKAGVLVGPSGSGWLRAVTHLDVGAEAIEKAAAAFAGALGGS